MSTIENNSTITLQSTIQQSDIKIETPLPIIRLIQPVRQSSNQTPIIPMESLNITDDFADLEESSFHIPTQRFRHIESSRTPKFIGNQLIRECSVCCSLKLESEYLAPLSKDCQHFRRTVCYKCVYQHIMMILGSLISNPITCPELICQARFSVDDVRQILMHYENMTLLDKYDTYLNSAFLETMPDFIWCAHGCGSGQLHPNYTPKVHCINCRQSTCFFHRIPWHEGVTCKEYDQFESSDEAVTFKYLNKFTKQCPKCRIYIEKNNGCDHMTCTRCSTEFCWDCLADFGSAHSLYACKHKTTCIYFQTYPIYLEPYYRPSLRRRLRTAICTIL